MCRVDVGIQAVYVDGEKVGLGGYSHGSDGIQKVVGVLEIAWVLGGEGTQEVVYV